MNHVQRRHVRRRRRRQRRRRCSDLAERHGNGGLPRGFLGEIALQEPRGPAVEEVEEEDAAEHGEQNHGVVPEAVVAGTAVVQRERGKALGEIALRDRPHVRRRNALRGDPVDLFRGERREERELRVVPHGGEEQREQHVVVDLLVAPREEFHAIGNNSLIRGEGSGVSDEHEGVVEGEIALDEHVREGGGPEFRAVEAQRLHGEGIGEDEVGDVRHFVDVPDLHGRRNGEVPRRC